MSEEAGILKSVARPTKLTSERLERIVEAIRQGAYVEVAARSAGIAPSTFYEWRRRGETGELPFSEFSEAVDVAEAQAELAALGCIRSAWEKGDWRASFKFLERRFPARWAERSRVRLGEADDEPPEASTASLLDPECQALSRALVKRASMLREADANRRVG
jgi:transposase-like protein